MRLFPSFSNVRIAWNALPVTAAKQATLTSWDIGELSWSPNDTTLYELKRYKNETAHWVTTGWIDQTAFTLESTLGKIYPLAILGGPRVALYGCKGGNVDQFVSLDSACEGQYVIGLNGYIFGEPLVGQPSVAIYRCATGHDHFVSTDPACEGSHTDELLGYILPE
jgi:hypothetical protein